MANMEVFRLPDGFALPKIGFGTYKLNGGEGRRAIRCAAEAGYRFFDTASLYETERNLGAALRESGIPREEFIIGTKLWIDEMDDPRAALERSLRRLGTDYVDLYLIHWPRRTGAADEDWKGLDLKAWQVMEKLADEGKALHLGLSNFLPHHTGNILEHCRIRPVVDQLEIHPGYLQGSVTAYCRENGILPMAWSPFGRGKTVPAGNGFLEKLAAKYGKSVQQVTLRFLVESGVMPIPKASSEAHIRDNLDIFSFALTDEERSMIAYMPADTWQGEHPDFRIPTARSNPDQ